MSEPPDPVVRAARSAERHWYEDGLQNIYRGFLMLLLATGYFPSGPFPRQSRTETILSLVSLCAFFLFCILLLAHRRIIGWIKTKMTFPRTGYAAPPPSAAGIKTEDTGFWPAPLPTPAEEDYLERREKTEPWIYFLLVAAWVLTLFLAHARWPSRGVVLVWAISLGLAGNYTQPPGRSAWAGVILCVTSGIAATLLPLSNSWRLPAFLFLLGTISTAAGVFQLSVFLLRHPRLKSTEP